MSRLDTWDYSLPDASIARYPTEKRDQSRLMVIDRESAEPTDTTFATLLDWLRPDDLLVANNTKVMPARLYGNRSTGGKVEFLILSFEGMTATALARPAKRLQIGEWVLLAKGERVCIEGKSGAPGECALRFERSADEVMQSQGAMPLPPYLGRQAEAEDSERYQTVFAGPLGAAAAPTAGLHFTPELLERVKQRGVHFELITLHVGVGTFRPLTEDDMERGRLHTEAYDIPIHVAKAVRKAKEAGGRVIAVGTTSCRTLESATPIGQNYPIAGPGSTDIFIQPPYEFRCVDGLLTNFHLPRSSLMMLVAALVNRQSLLAAYQSAVEKGYRFYSYGDAMLLL